MHKGSEPRQIFNFSLDNALTAMLNSLSLSLSYTHTHTSLPFASMPDSPRTKDISPTLTVDILKQDLSTFKKCLSQSKRKEGERMLTFV